MVHIKLNLMSRGDMKRGHGKKGKERKNKRQVRACEHPIESGLSGDIDWARTGK